MRKFVRMRIRLYIDKRQNKDGTFPVRLSVSLYGKRYMTTLGYSMTESQFDNLHRAFNGAGVVNDDLHTQHQTILRTLRTIGDKLDWEETKVKRGEKKADEIDLSAIINECKGREAKQQVEYKTFEELFLCFSISEKNRKDISDQTLNLLSSFRRKILSDYPGITIDVMATKSWVQRFVETEVSKGMSNVTVRSSYRILHWFLVWAYQNDYCTNDFMSYRFELKIIETREKLVVFLTLDEIQKIQMLNLPPHIDLYRDIFLFQCFTGLRYSDVHKLRCSDINGDTMTLVTQKTGVALQNKLNRYALEIVDKYKDRYGERLFPAVSLTNINHFVKIIAKLAEIDEPVTKVEYRNHRREEITLPKWQLMSSHVGRKTFVVNSLDMGLTATQVIGYTGHSSITAMQPYISISRKKKDAAMDIWDNADIEDNKKGTPKDQSPTDAPDTEINKLKSEIKALERRLEALKRDNDKDVKQLSLPF